MIPCSCEINFLFWSQSDNLTDNSNANNLCFQYDSIRFSVTLGLFIKKKMHMHVTNCIWLHMHIHRIWNGSIHIDTLRGWFICIHGTIVIKKELYSEKPAKSLEFYNFWHLCRFACSSQNNRKRKTHHPTILSRPNYYNNKDTDKEF